MKTLADDVFRYLRESCTSNHFGLIRRKGVYPYDYLRRMRSLASCLVAQVRTRSIHTQLECGLPLDVRQWQITTTFTCSWMCCSKQTFLKSSVHSAWSTAVSIRYIITPLMVLPRMRLSEYHVLIYSL